MDSIFIDDSLIIRAAQSGLIDLDPAMLYQLLKAHGADIVGSVALSGAAIMWYLLPVTSS